MRNKSLSVFILTLWFLACIQPNAIAASADPPAAAVVGGSRLRSASPPSLAIVLQTSRNKAPLLVQIARGDSALFVALG